MRNFTLVMVPGGGATGKQVAFGTTLAQFAAAEGLSDRELTLVSVDGEIPVPREQWATTTLDTAIELYAVRPVKGA